MSDSNGTPNGNGLKRARSTSPSGTAKKQNTGGPNAGGDDAAAAAHLHQAGGLVEAATAAMEHSRTSSAEEGALPEGAVGSSNGQEDPATEGMKERSGTGPEEVATHGMAAGSILTSDAPATLPAGPAPEGTTAEASSPSITIRALIVTQDASIIIGKGAIFLLGDRPAFRLMPSLRVGRRFSHQGD